jgi:hypothetical protein
MQDVAFLQPGEFIAQDVAQTPQSAKSRSQGVGLNDDPKIAGRCDQELPSRSGRCLRLGEGLRNKEGVCGRRIAAQATP